MKSIIRKLSAILLAFAMAFTLSSVSTFAASASDTVNVTVKGVETDATVTGYKIVEATYDGGGFTGYKAVSGVSIADVTKPTDAEIGTIIATKLSSLDTVEFKESTDGEGNVIYTSKNAVEAGTYLVLVESTGTTIYNPMVVSAGYDNSSTLTTGTVSADGSFTTGGNTYYAKKATVDVEKTTADGANHSDLNVGDVQSFQIETKIPSYDKDVYKNDVIFNIGDTLDRLKLDQDSIKVYAGDIDTGELLEESEDYDLVAPSDNGFTVSLKSAYIKSHANTTIYVVYDATILEAAVNYNAAKNTATITYSNNPNGGTGSDTDTTYHYTFALNGSLGGTSTTINKKVTDFVKVKEDGSVVVDSTKEDYSDVVTVNNPLEGAEFTLYTDEDCTKVATKTLDNGTVKKQVVTSESDGSIEFTGLDAGVYYLKETKAPSGYAASSTKRTVEIKPYYKANGTLESYEVIIDGTTVSKYEATCTGDTVTNITAKTVNPLAIKNTQIKELPSTGGMGTYIFTILGVMLMSGAAIAYALKRRKEA